MLSRDNASAMDRPIPRLAPVTIATLSAKFRFITVQQELQTGPASISSVFLTKPTRGKIFEVMEIVRVSHLGRINSKRSRVRQYQCGEAMRPMRKSFSVRIRFFSASNNSSRK